MQAINTTLIIVTAIYVWGGAILSLWWAYRFIRMLLSGRLKFVFRLDKTITWLCAILAGAVASVFWIQRHPDFPTLLFTSWIASASCLVVALLCYLVLRIRPFGDMILCFVFMIPGIPLFIFNRRFRTNTN
jgi:hypothetical protein